MLRNIASSFAFSLNLRGGTSCMARDVMYAVPYPRNDLQRIAERAVIYGE
jgi:hypothetical protein